MTVGHLMCSFRKFPYTKTEIHLRKDFGLHEHSLWLLNDRQFTRLRICVCVVPHMDWKLELQRNRSWSVYIAEYILYWLI
jgi:hypothetical protein